LEHEQRKLKPVSTENSPLIDYSLRQVIKEDGGGEGKGTNWQQIMKENKTGEIYCGYSCKKKSNKIIYY
jgi:hypothetical protein